MESQKLIILFTQTLCTTLHGVGPTLAKRLSRCGVLTIQDLLFHLPLHYQDRTHVAPIASVRIGEKVVVDGKIDHVDIVSGKRRALMIRLQDGTGEIYLRFFHFMPSQRQSFTQGMRLRCFGEIRKGFLGKEIIHPDYQLIFSDKPLPVEESLTPIYPTTEGLHQKTWHSLISQGLEWLRQNEANLPEYLPSEVLTRFYLPHLHDALRYVHQPPPDACRQKLELGLHPAQRRLAFEELLAQRLGLLNSRNKIQAFQGFALNDSETLLQAFINKLPFELTSAQQRVMAEIKADMQTHQPMQRLVQGDVGSGKTIIALLAILHAVENQLQAALMVPTELLAEQHFQTIQILLQPLAIKVGCLTGKHKGKQRRGMLAAIKNGEIPIVIGTHALFQEAIEFSRLGLIVIDEQHRFGVHQRLALWEKGKQTGFVPHQLIMTATPIPRTLAMTMYADIDISAIDQLPPGRKPVTTVVMPHDKREKVIERIRQVCLQKRQCYWVCPLIDESDVINCQAAEASYRQLTELLPELRIGIIHGRTQRDLRISTMQAFKQAELDILVATTVIEVGVDVANANLIIIENPERLGLAQLHQLRGRVGRSHQDSYCVLLYQGPLTEQAKARLSALRDTQDGFLIAQKDLELRGPGELLGARQTGLMQFRIADLTRDQDLLGQIQEVADLLMKHYPDCVDQIISRWLKNELSVLV